MDDSLRDIDALLRAWKYKPEELLVRRLRAADGRPVLQMRVDLGVLQMEVAGRPDGARPGGFDTYYDELLSLAAAAGDEFFLDQDHYTEVDREFVQFYYRRICWLALREYSLAAEDAKHTLALMDFTAAHAIDESWVMMHEQYRPFVLFHHTQAAALESLEESDPENALRILDEGLAEIHTLFSQQEEEDTFDEDELVEKLREMREALVKHYELGPSLAEQLARAVANEQYELAAELRDRIAARRKAIPD